MIACFDVHYREDFAQAAAVLLKDWTDTEAAKTYVIQTPLAGEYEPGQFYKRELPVLQELLSQIEESLSFLVVDSYVYLGPERPG
ncbi:MAG: endonuclease V, partial [Bacteroidota bacterium]